MQTKQINLLPREDRTRLLKVAIGACLSTSAIMVFTMVWGRTTGTREALIGKDATTTENVSTSVSPEVSPNIPKALTSNPAGSVSLALTSDTIRYYENQTGRAFQANLQTQRTETLSDTKLSGLVHTFWSPSGQEVVSVFDTPGEQVFRYYNYLTKKSSNIGTAVISAAFSPNGRQLAFIDTSSDATTIYTSNTDGTEARKVLATRAEQATIQWPQEDILALTSQRVDRTGRDLSLISLDGKISILFSNKENFEHTWSRDGKKILFSYFDKDQGIQLWYADLSGSTPTNLNVQTSASKCAWTPDASTVVCGVPMDSALIKDVSASQTATIDDIVRIDIYSGEQQKLYSGRKSSLLGIREPLISSSGAFVVFQNLFDQRLYSFKL